MTEYIDREALFSYLFNKQDEPLNVIKEIAEFPTANVVKVVRCRDCKHYVDAPDYVSHNIGQKICRSPNLDFDTECGDLWMWMDPDDFCNYGERGADNG